MWEEPRPERLRELDSDRSGSIEKSVLAWAVIFGVAVILLKVGAIDLGRNIERKHPPAPAPGTQTQPVADEPATVRSRNATDQGNWADTREARPSSPRQPATDSAPGDTSVMRTLAATCQYWTAENTNGQYWGNQQMACQEMATYAREHGFAMPAITKGKPSLPTESQNAGPQHQVSVYVNECDSQPYGSIAFRQCRAGEKRRLESECQQLRDGLQQASGARRHTLLARTSATCSAANRYHIVQ